MTSGTITVTANTAPAAPDASAIVNGYTFGTGPVARLEPTAMDPDDAPATLLYEVLNPPKSVQGTLSVVGSALSFSPTRGYTGT